MRNLKKYSIGLLFILPLTIITLAFIAYPVLQSIILSFFKWPGFGEWEFVGITNYIKMFTADRLFLKSLSNTFIYTLIVPVGLVFIGLLMALVVHLKVPGWKVYRVIFLLPIAIMQGALALMWARMLSPAGLINTFLGWLHLEALQHAWLGEPRVAFFWVILITIWQYPGGSMLYLLGGLQTIDEEIYEAAYVDGAGTIRRIISITIPMIKNVIGVVLLIQIIFAFKVFDVVYFLTGGDPANSTEVLGIRLYSLAFEERKFGYASVLAVVMIITSIIFGLMYVRFGGYGKRSAIDQK